MTDEIKITTFKKKKDPKKVAAGHRLAAIGQEARRAKKRLELEPKNNEKHDDKGDENGGWNINYVLLFGVIGVITSVGALYYTRKDYTRETQRLETITEEPKEYNHVTIENKSEKNPVKLDTLD